VVISAFIQFVRYLEEKLNLNCFYQEEKNFNPFEGKLNHASDK